MSKSLGNQTFPQDVIKHSGADILRLWVASVDYSDDQRIGPEILKSVSDNYRKLRNTLRWMLGTLAHYDPARAVGYAKMEPLDRLMLHKLAELDGVVRQAYANFDYARVIAALSQFMNSDLSAFYFDIRKDALYCEPPSSAKRLGALEAIEHIFRTLTIWLAPVLCFTADEAWASRYPNGRSVAPRAVPRTSRGMARRGARREVGNDSARSLGGNRRPRDLSRGERDRVVARGPPHRLSRGRQIRRGARGRRLRRSVHRQRPDDCRELRRRKMRSAFPTRRAWRSSCSAPAALNACARGAISTPRPPIPSTPG